MSAHFTTPTDELLLLAETLGEVKTKADKLEAEFATQARPLEAATNALSAALSGIKALQFHVLDNNLGALSARVEEMRKAVDEQVGVIALELKKADETNAAKAGQEAEALRSEIAALQAQLGTLGSQFSAQLERVEFSAKEEAKKLQLIPGPAGAAGASLNPRGTFIDGETYNRLDVVSWLGSSYIAAVDGVTEKPSKNSNQWQVLASRGSGGAGGAGDFGSLAGVAQINQGGTGQTTRAAGLNALLPSQTGNVQYMLLTDGAGTVSWGAQPVAGLPSQTSNGGKLLTTDGTNASWSNAVTVSGSNATVTGTLTVSGTGTTTIGGTGAVGSPRLFLSGDAGLQIKNATSSRYRVDFYANNVIAKGVLDAYDDTGSAYIPLLISGSRLEVDNTTASTTTSTGALVVGNGTSGGLGVGGNITLGGGVNIAGAASDPLPAGTSGIWTLSGSGLRINSAGVTFASLTGTTLGTATVTVNGTTASSAYNIGALVVSGGVGVGNEVSVYGRVRAQLGLHADGNVPAGLAASYQTDVQSGTTRDILSFGNSTRAGLIRGYQDGGGVVQWSFGRYTASLFEEQMRLSGTTAASSSLTIYGTTASTSTSSGALVVSGGVGVAGAGFFGGNIVAAGNVVCGSATNQAVSIAGGTANDGGNVIVYGSTHASDPNTGRIRVGTTTITSWDSNDFTIASGKGLRVGNAYAAGAPTATGYIVIKDSTGTSYKIPAVAL